MTARERLAQIERDYEVCADGPDCRACVMREFLRLSLRRALDALEQIEVSKNVPRMFAALALADIDALAARGETGGMP